MCGIAGIVDPAGFHATALAPMAEALRHRGPDGEGFAVVEASGELRLATRDALGADARVVAGLAHRRLAIIDLTDASSQPAVDPSGRLALAYNGELYNYVELRRELEALGRRFRTTGDTEVVLQAWAQWGPSCVDRFVGMWAFAVLDRELRTLVLCRDRFGIKPLFWTRLGGGLRFASEIKGLLAAVPVPEPDEATVAAFLLSGADTQVRTFFRGIERIPPAHRMTIPLDDPGSAALERYWRLADDPGTARPDAAEAFRDLFADSVRLHTRSDVSVGTCLSGGLDSSAIVCTAAALHRDGALPPNYRHHAFGYVPPDESFSERRWMELATSHAGLELTEVHPSPERFDARLEDVVRQQDEPFGSTSIAAQWFVFEAAREARMKVMLDGQGADEVLGGYHSYLATVAAGHVAGGRRMAYARLALDHRRRLGAWPLPWSSTATLVPPALRTVRDRLVALRRDGHDGGAGPVPAIGDVLAQRLHETAAPGEPIPSEMQALLRQQTTSGNLPALLRYEDRNSMAHSIEARVPFLDHRLVELAFSLPPEAKVRGADTKRLLRQAMKGILPEPIRLRRDKLGFRADPSAAARFAASRRAALRESRSGPEREWFDTARVDELIEASQSNPTLDFPLWRVVNVKLWARAHWGEGAAP
jgi:asparagine synthase (glutamine-hydrolysing)